MAPDFERLARIPWPIASLASSGIKPFSSALDRSCSRKACRVVRKIPANSAQEFDALNVALLQRTYESDISPLLHRRVRCPNHVDGGNAGRPGSGQ